MNEIKEVDEGNLTQRRKKLFTVTKMAIYNKIYHLRSEETNQGNSNDSQVEPKSQKVAKVDGCVGQGPLSRAKIVLAKQEGLLRRHVRRDGLRIGYGQLCFI